MEIRLIENRHIDRQRWDHCISQSVNGNIYAYSWYLDQVADHWDALVEGDYDAVFPLTWKRKLGILYLCQPPFSQQLGIFSRGHLTPDTVQSFLEKIPAHYQLIEIQLNTHNPVTPGNWKLRERPNLELELIQPYEVLARDYSENLRRNLKKAAQTGWVIVEEPSPAMLVEIFRKNRGKDLSTLKEEDYRKLLSLVEACRKRGTVFILGAGEAGKPVQSGTIWLKSHRRIIMVFSAADSEAKAKGAMPMMIDAVIRSRAGTETILDFEGSEDPGLARFYAGFGATTFHYSLISRNTLSLIPGIIKSIRDKLRR